MITKEPMAYIATKDCGCIVAAMLVNSIEKKVLGKLVAEWVAAGYNIEFVTHSYVLSNWDLCRHGHKQAQLTEAAARAAEEEVKTAADQNGQAELGIMSYSVAEDGTVGDLVTGAEVLAENGSEVTIVLAASDDSESEDDDTDLPDEDGITEKLYVRAKRVAEKEGTFSIALLQEKLRVRWHTAAQLVARMKADSLAVPKQLAGQPE